LPINFGEKRGRMATDSQVIAGEIENKDLQLMQFNNRVQFRLLLLVLPVIRLQYCRIGFLHFGLVGQKTSLMHGGWRLPV
jgi:hypothetical protein